MALEAMAVEDATGLFGEALAPGPTQLLPEKPAGIVGRELV